MKKLTLLVLLAGSLVSAYGEVSYPVPRFVAGIAPLVGRDTDDQWQLEVLGSVVGPLARGHSVSIDGTYEFGTASASGIVSLVRPWAITRGLFSLKHEAWMWNLAGFELGYEGLRLVSMLPIRYADDDLEISLAGGYRALYPLFSPRGTGELPNAYLGLILNFSLTWGIDLATNETGFTNKIVFPHPTVSIVWAK